MAAAISPTAAAMVGKIYRSCLPADNEKNPTMTPIQHHIRTVKRSRSRHAASAAAISTGDSGNESPRTTGT
jgi:hypothetical protein